MECATQNEMCNRTLCGPPNVLQEFERRALASPDALALVCEGRQVTYRELNLTADRVADVLREAGVAGGTMVGVLLDRSPDMVAGLIGDMEGGRGLRSHSI